MDISKMLKRVTSDKKYLITAICIAIAALNTILGMFSPSYGEIKFFSLVTNVISLVALASLFIYALNYHGTRGAKTTLYAYFLLSVANTVLYAIINIFVGAIAFSVLFSVLISLLFPCLMLGFIFMGVKGMPVYALAFLECARRLILNIRGGIFLNVEGIITLLLVVNGIVLTFAIAHLISTDK